MSGEGRGAGRTGVVVRWRGWRSTCGGGNRPLARHGVRVCHLAELRLKHCDFVCCAPVQVHFHINEWPKQKNGNTHPSRPRPVLSMLSAVGRPASVTGLRARGAAPCWSSGAWCANVTTSLRPRKGRPCADSSAFIASCSIRPSAVCPLSASAVARGPCALRLRIALAWGQQRRSGSTGKWSVSTQATAG